MPYMFSRIKEGKNDFSVDKRKFDMDVFLS